MFQRISTFFAAIAFVVVFTVTQRPSLAVPQGWTEDFAGAKTTAASSKKDLLLEFTGSDWCPPCKILKAKIFDSSHFQTEAPKGFVLVELDFPNDKSNQTAGVIAQNKELAEAFRIMTFPTVILADATGMPYAQLSGFQDETPEEYTAMLAAKKKLRAARDVALAKAKEAKGIDRAKALDAALNAIAIQATLMMTAYESEINEIMKLDADKSAGLYVKYEAIRIAPEIEEKVSNLLVSSNDSAVVIARIEALIKERKLIGQALQEALFGMAIAKHRDEDIEATVTMLKKALAVAPNSEKALQIPMIISNIESVEK